MTGSVRLHIVLNNLKIKVISKSVDLPNVPEEGYRQSHSALKSFAFFSESRVAESSSVNGRSVGG